MNDVRVAAAAGGDVDRLDLAVAQRRRRHLDRRRGARQPVALEEPLDGGLHVALGVAGRLGERVHHLAHDLARPLVVEAARLELHEAALRHHVRRRAALDAADVRGRLGVDAGRSASRLSPALAAAIALWPASGRIPACAALPLKRASTE